MDYEKAYKEVLSRAKTKYDSMIKQGVVGMAENIAELFPELKESEDEQPRKWILEYLYDGLRKSDEQFKDQFKGAIAWFEKQGEHIKFLESIQIGDEVTRNPDGVLVNLSQLKRKVEQGEQNLANSAKTCKDEPKFKVGDWVIDKQDIVHQIANVVENVTNHTYGYDIVGGGYFNDNTEGVRLWTIEDAKDGDVLYTPKGCGVEGIFLIGGWKQVEDTGRTLCSDIGYRVEDDEIIVGGLGAIWWKGVIDPFYPATKEQRDLLFQKMKEAGYSWDAEKKKLKKIEQNPAWGEEDEKMIGRIRVIIEKYAFSQSAVDVNGDLCEREFIEPDEWLRTLKYRAQPQPKSDWNDNDEISFNRLMAICADERVRISPVFSEKEIKDLMDWFKSIKTRVLPQWKPSDEQMKILQYLCETSSHPNEKVIPTMESLYNDLKKLKR